MDRKIRVLDSHSKKIKVLWANSNLLPLLMEASWVPIFNNPISLEINSKNLIRVFKDSLGSSNLKTFRSNLKTKHRDGKTSSKTSVFHNSKISSFKEAEAVGEVEAEAEAEAEVTNLQPSLISLEHMGSLKILVGIATLTKTTDSPTTLSPQSL